MLMGGAVSRIYYARRHELTGQACLLLAETGCWSLLLWRPWLGVAAIASAHLWAWSRTAQRQRDRDRFLEMLRSEVGRDSD